MQHFLKTTKGIREEKGLIAKEHIFAADAVVAKYCGAKNG